MKRSEKMVIALAATAIVASAAFLSISMLARSRRDAAMAQLLASPVETPPTPAAPSTESEALEPFSTGPVAADSFQQLLDRAKVLRADWPLEDFNKAWAQRAHMFTDEEWAEGERLATKHRELIAELAAAVAAKAPIPPITWENGDLLGTLGILALLDAEVAFRRGDGGGGVERISTVLDYVLAMAAAGSDFSPWHEVFHHSCDVMNRALPNPLPPPAAEALIARLDMFDPTETAARTITAYAQGRAENWVEEVESRRDSGQSWFQRPLRRTENLLDDLLQRGVSETLYDSALGSAMVDRDIATFLDFMVRTRDAACLPYADAHRVAQAIDRESEALDESSYFLSKWYRIPSEGIVIGIAISTARRDLIQLGIVVERYYADHAEYPPTLETVALDLGRGLPIDPFSGEPYIYRPEGGRFLLYSIGMNQADDYGNPNGLDLVWRPWQDAAAQ